MEPDRSRTMIRSAGIRTATVRSGRREGERGIALALVLAVLVCLLAVAIPFAISMRHEQGSAAFRSFDDDARRTAVSVRDLALAPLGDTAPDRDPTPWSDGAEETAVDLDALGKSLALEDLGPRGRLLSVEVEDQSGRVDLHRASLYLIARVLGLSSPLARKVSPDDKEIRLVDGSFLQDEGFLWIDGEITRYRRRDGSAVADLIRPAMVPGVWEPEVLPNLAPRDFEAGEEAIDFRAWMVAAWLFKSPAASGSKSGRDTVPREARFETLSHPFAIAQFGAGALGEEQRARLDRFCTLWHSDGGRDRFGQATRVFTAIVANETRELRVESGHYVGRGTLFRLSTYDGQVEYGFVLRSQRRDNGFQLVLEVPLTIAADAYQSWIEFVVPRPVNVNACSRELLELLLTRLKPYGQKEVDEQMAALVAERIVAARPLAGMKALVDLLENLVTKDKTLKGEQRDAILWNAEHSGAFPLEFASAPFCFASEGVFEVSAAASLNYPMNGREKARASLRETIAVAGAGRSVRTYTTQRDFDEPWRFTRLARGWTSLPENLQIWDPGLGSADPPSRLRAYEPPRSRSPSEQMNGVAARLAPGRMTIAQAQNDRTWHFDGSQGDLDSPDPDGWRFSDGPLAFAVDGGQKGVPLVQGSGTSMRPGPFGVSMWWNPGRNLGSEQTLFDWKANAHAMDPQLHDRIRLRFIDNKLELEANDAFLRESAQDRYTSRIVFNFDDLPLEADTWYHVTAFCRGNRAGQMSLWVDGKPRGKWSHYSRTSSQFLSSSDKLAIEVNRLANGTTSFPIPGTVRVGTQVYEYTAAGGGSLTTKHDPNVKFGGARPAPNLPAKGTSSSGQQSTNSINHPAQSSAELYGYSARLTSHVPDGSASLAGEGLGKFGVVKVAKSSAKDLIDLSGTGGPAFPIGMGFEAAASQLDVCGLDNNAISSNSKVLAKGGGFALLVSYYFGNLNAYNPVTKTNEGVLDSYKTSKGSFIQGVEVISYGAFDGNKITGLRRGLAVAAELEATDLVESSNKPVGHVFPTIYHFVQPHAFVITPDTHVWQNLGQIKEFVVLVIPISIAASGSNITSHFLLPQVNAGNDLAEMLQIDTGFNSNGKDSTEWVRYDAIVKDQGGRWNFVRADPDHISNAQYRIEGSTRLRGNMNATNGGGPNNLLSDIALNPANYAFDSASYKTLCNRINFEDVANSKNSNLAFRGVLETYDSEHSAGIKLYPVFRTQLGQGLPGRYDEVTLIGTHNERPERHIVNYGWPKPGVEDWPNHAHSAFLTEVNRKFLVTPAPGFNVSNPTGYIASATYYAESRNFARMLKFPSGELPSAWDGSSSLRIADGTGDGAKVDEVRIFSAEDPQPLFANGLYVLRRDVTVSEQSRVELLHDGLRFPGSNIGPLAGLLGHHTDACVLQIGDEFVVCGQRTDGIPIVQDIAEEGRTRFGDTPGFHEAGETAMVLPWPVMARLGNGISATDSLIPLQDGQQFPRNGFALIDREVLAYTDVARTDGPTQLYVPSFLHETGVIGSQERGRAAFRGRFGTLPSSHAADAIVFFWPWRYPDGYAERCDAPEMASLDLPIAARRALFHSLVWKDEQSDRLASLVATVRVQGRGGFAADPGVDPDFFVFDQPGTLEEPNLIDRQGDLLRVRFNVRYRDGALDSLDFSRNSWKRAPKLTIVGVEYLADRVVETHEETR